jgi:hypothetical protein
MDVTVLSPEADFGSGRPSESRFGLDPLHYATFTHGEGGVVERVKGRGRPP